MNNRRMLGVVLVLLSAIGYACLPIIIKYVYEETDLRPADLLIVRFLLAVFAMWVLIIMRQEVNLVLAMPIRRLLRVILPGGLFAVAALCAFIALDSVPATTFTVLLYTYPAIVALIMFALGERLAWLRWVAIGLALMGCVLVVGGKLEKGSLMGMGLVIINSTLYATYMVLSSRIAAKVPGFAFGALSMTGTLLFLLPIIPFQGLRFPDSGTGWGLILGLVTVATLLPILTLFLGMRYIGATNSAIISTIEPVITVILAAVLLHERTTLIQYAGGGLIIVSVILLQLPTRTVEVNAPVEASTHENQHAIRSAAGN